MLCSEFFGESMQITQVKTIFTRIDSTPQSRPKRQPEKCRAASGSIENKSAMIIPHPLTNWSIKLNLNNVSANRSSQLTVSL